MKLIYLLCLLLAANSCSEKSIGGEENEIALSDPENIEVAQSQNPSEISLIAKVIQKFDAKTSICGQEKNNMFSIKVVRILSHGQGVVNLPIKDQELMVQFLNLDKTVSEEDELTLTAKESLCSDASSTYLTVLKYEF